MKDEAKSRKERKKRGNSNDGREDRFLAVSWTNHKATRRNAPGVLMLSSGSRPVDKISVRVRVTCAARTVQILEHPVRYLVRRTPDDASTDF